MRDNFDFVSMIAQKNGTLCQENFKLTLSTLLWQPQEHLSVVDGCFQVGGGKKAQKKKKQR